MTPDDPNGAADSGPSTDLPTRLKQATWPLHREVERAGLMRRILTGDFDRGEYMAMLRNLQAIYAALEHGLDLNHHQPWIAAIDAPALRRSSAIASDLVAFGQATPGTREADLRPAARRYAARLQALARDEPGLLVAHAYVRYLGDLSGGQLLQRIVARTLGLVPPEGLRFYAFDGQAQAAALAQAFRHGLASIEPGPRDGKRLVDESRWAFAQHGELFRELDAPRAADHGAHAANS